MIAPQLAAEMRALLSQASTDAAAFDAALDRLAPALGATSAVAFVPSADPKDGFGVATIGWNAPYTDAGQAFTMACGRLDPWRETLTQTGLDQERWVLLGDDILPHDQWGDSPWPEFFDRVGIYDVLSCYDPGHGGDEAPLVLAFYRDKSRPRFARADQDVMRALADDVRRAANMRLLPGAGAGLDGLLAAAFTALPEPAWLTHPSGRVIWANAAAHAMMARGDAIAAPGGYLSLADAAGAARLSGALAATRAHRGADLVLATPADPRLPVRISPVQHRGFSVALVMARPAPPPDARTHRLARRFKLSLSETAILPALIAGASARTIAADRRVSADTVRSQIKSIYAKLRVNRRVQLALRLEEEGE